MQGHAYTNTLLGPSIFAMMTCVENMFNTFYSKMIHFIDKQVFVNPSKICLYIDDHLPTNNIRTCT